MLHIMSQGHGRGGLWWVEMDFDDGQQQVVHGTGGAWHWWLSCWFLVCGLCGLSVRQDWAAVMIVRLNLINHFVGFIPC